MPYQRSIIFFVLVIQISVVATQSAVLYTNPLIDQSTISADFDDYSFINPGVGSFEADTLYGLQVLSQAPNSYQGIKVKKTPFSKSQDLQAQVVSYVSSSIDPSGSQVNPYYSAGIIISKYAKNPDGTPDMDVALQNYAIIELARDDDLDGIQQYFHYRFDSDGEIIFDDYIPLGNTENLILKVKYSAINGQISFSYSLGSNIFTNCPVIFNGWNDANFDGILVGVLASTVPSSPLGQPAPQATCSVGPGEVYLRDLEISSSISYEKNDFLLSLEKSTDNLSSWQFTPINQYMLNHEGKVIVPKPQGSPNSFFRMRIQPATN